MGSVLWSAWTEGTVFPLSKPLLEEYEMRLIRCFYRGTVWSGILHEDTIYRLRGTVENPELGEPVASLDQVQLLPPCVPTKVLAVGRNYAAHAAEFDNPLPSEPLLFLKPPSSVIGPGGAIVRPRLSARVDHEAELAVVIAHRCRRVPPERALEYVLGYTCANDVTARDLQERDGQWARAKGFDTFCPLGPWIVPGLDPGALEVVGRVNGQVRQYGNTRDLIFPVPKLIAYISAVMTLEPGDVILTGTPAGVGPLQPGDLVEVEISGIGTLANPVVDEQPTSR
jgi:2-keto-4-pentenoate hydratase/2-oxohepta-3-ene-1,7-dioic acid hydratase in catechol pathway